MRYHDKPTHLAFICIYITDIQILVIWLVERTSRDIHYYYHRRSKSPIRPLFPMFLSSRAPLLKQTSTCAKGCDPIMSTSNDLCIRANKPKTCEVWNCWCSKTLISCFSIIICGIFKILKLLNLFTIEIKYNLFRTLICVILNNVKFIFKIHQMTMIYMSFI